MDDLRSHRMESDKVVVIWSPVPNMVELATYYMIDHLPVDNAAPMWQDVRVLSE